MEQLLAIILVIIMIIIDNKNVEKFVSKCCSINPFDTAGDRGSRHKKNLTCFKKVKPSLLPYRNCPDCDLCSSDKSKKKEEHFFTKKNLWIFVDEIPSDKQWKHFYSRNNKSPSYDINKLCIQTIKNNTKNNFNLRIITKNNVKKLLPGHKKYLTNKVDPYVYNNYLKYAILKKYGGLWMPKDLIIYKKMENINSNKLITFGLNNNNIVDNVGFSDEILFANKENVLVSKMLSYIKCNYHSFQNALIFKKSINKFFNKMIYKHNQNHLHMDLIANRKVDNSFLDNSDLFSTNFVNIKNFERKNMIRLQISNINRFHKYNFILKLNKNELISSNLFITYLLKYALY